jgi:diguanylate cyclase (GGDEF)-like protein
MNSTLLTSYFVQAAGALITAGIFGGFYRDYRKAFLRDWALSWSAWCVSLLCAAAGVVLGSRAGLAPDTAIRLALSVVGGAAGYVQVVWLVLGSAHLAGHGTPTDRQRAWIAAGAAAVGIALALIGARDPDGSMLRIFLRVGVHGMVAGLAFISSALHVWRSRGVHRIGRRIVVWALVAFGVSQISLLGMALVLSPDVLHPNIELSLGFAQFVLTFVIGLGVVVWLLEEQHFAARENADKVKTLAFHDPLTGLPNRKLYLDRLELSIPQAQRGRHKLAVFFIDVDRFKVVNDSLGHVAGDRLLQAVATRIRVLLRDTDTVARMGGDEFTVLTPLINTIEDALIIARKVTESIKEPLVIEGHELFITASIGVSVFPEDGSDAESLLRNADTAMYRAKAQGGDQLQLYTAEMNQHATQQLALESSLRHGVEALEFELHYQPIVRTADGSVYAMEAMLRWRHPVLGLVRPEQFLRIAESTGMIVPIAEWTLREACRQLAEWRAEGFPELHLAVNISTRQLQQRSLPHTVRIVLEEYNLPPSALELEINETSATESAKEAVSQLRDLKSLGVNISIDDFGTGYSSLSSLRAFPVDALKIDTSFVRNLVRDDNDTAIAVAVIALAKSLGLRVIAEGVEHPSQLAFLHAQECQFWQGYLCCPPVEPKEAKLMLRRMSTPGGRILSPATSIAITR